MAEPIKMSFGMWTWVGPSKHALDVVCNLASMIEPSTCDGNVALCQTTSTTCFTMFLWSPYVIEQTIIFLPCSFFLLPSIFFLFPRLISAVGDWMSTILLHMAWP